MSTGKRSKPPSKGIFMSVRFPIKIRRLFVSCGSFPPPPGEERRLRNAQETEGRRSFPSRGGPGRGALAARSAAGPTAGVLTEGKPADSAGITCDRWVRSSVRSWSCPG